MIEPMLLVLRDPWLGLRFAPGVDDNQTIRIPIPSDSPSFTLRLLALRKYVAGVSRT